MVPLIHPLAVDVPFGEREELHSARLTQTYAVTDVGALVERISQATGVRLTVDSRCKRLKLALKLTERPVVEVLSALETLVSGRWEPQGKGYAFSVDPKAIAARNAWWRAFEAEWDGSRRRLKDEVRRQMQRGDAFWQGIPAASRDTLVDSLADGFQRGLDTGSVPIVREGGVLLPMAELPASSVSSLVTQARSVNPDYDPERTVSLVAVNNGASFDAIAYQRSGVAYDTGASLRVPIEDPRFCLPLRHPKLPEQVAAMEKPRANLKTLASAQAQTLWSDDLDAAAKGISIDPKALARYTPSFNAQITNPARRWRLIAERFQLDFLADYHALPIPLRPGAPPGDGTLADALTRFRKDDDHSVRITASKLLLVRDNRWYRDDALEMPLPTAQALIARLYGGDYDRFKANRDTAKELGAFLDAAAAAQETLTPWQIANGLANYVDESQPLPLMPLAEIADLLLAWPKTCAFWRALTDDQRAALLKDSLAVDALGGNQARLLQAAAPQTRPGDRIRLIGVPATVRLQRGVTPPTSGLQPRFLYNPKATS